MDDARHRTLFRGIRILEAVAEAREGLSITELAQLMGADKSTVSRLVSTLVDIGYLARLKNRRIVLTGRVLQLTKGFREQFNLSEIALPYLVQLRDRTNETVILTIRERNYSVSINQLDPEQSFRMVPHVGNAAPLYGTAAGRAMLFALPVTEQHRIIRELEGSPVEHPEVRLDLVSLAGEVELARRRGFVWIPRTDDVERVAAVVLDRNGEPLAAVSIYGPKYRIKDRITELGAEAKHTAAQLTQAVFGVRSHEGAR